MKILGIVGSKRRNGNTAALVAKALETAASYGMETETVFIGDMDIEGCRGCEGCRKTYTCIIKDDMEALYPKLQEADGLVVGSPVYFYNMTASMKAFFERLYCHEVFDEEERAVWMGVNEALGMKFAATIAVGEQHRLADMGFTSESMNLSLAALGYRVADSLVVMDAFKRGTAMEDEKAVQGAVDAGRRLAKTLLLKKKIQETAPWGRQG